MTEERYWRGADLDLDEVWSDFDSGRRYEAKVAGLQLHLIRMTFDGPPLHLPLFGHEVIWKTVKGTFHDVKKECFTQAAYSSFGPVFLYRIARGSSIFEFLAELSPLVTWIVALGGASMWYRAALKKDQDLDEQQVAFLRREFPAAASADVSAYLKAWTSAGRRRVLCRLIEQGLRKVELSREPLVVTQGGTRANLVDMEVIVRLHTVREQTDKPQSETLATRADRTLQDDPFSKVTPSDKAVPGSRVLRGGSKIPPVDEVDPLSESAETLSKDQVIHSHRGKGE